MTPEQRAVGLTRRDFFKRAWHAGARVGIGLAAGELLLHTGNALNQGVERVTGHPAGNANVRLQYIRECLPEQPNCDTKGTYSSKENFYNVVLGPLWEELTMRGLPSGFLNGAQGNENAAWEMLVGNPEHLTLTRGEFIVGGAMATLFALKHNLIDEKTFDTKTIPAAQFLQGLVYWYLQRKGGIVPPILAHMWNNLRWHGKY